MAPLEAPPHTSDLLPESRYIWRARRPGHVHRLICFPYAGAGATAYADWAPLLPPEIELVAIQLPGRQNRIAEDPFGETGPLITALYHALRPVLDGSFSFFGHSGGAVAAYELAILLRSRGERGPRHLFVSAQPGPGMTGVRHLHQLPDDEFLAEIQALGGIERELADDPDVMALLLFSLRADFGLWERHMFVPRAPIDCPITVLCGESDPRTPFASLDRWRTCTSAGFSIITYPGGHFFFLSAIAEVVSFIGREMLGSLTHRRVP